MADLFYTIASPSEAQYTDKRSKFLAFAYPVSTAEEAKARVAELQKRYYDARHVCREVSRCSAAPETKQSVSL
ncbi:MAG: YigZ family protein, partial [Muribaculaceae bacterium]|nr:YigZ family protein [Muribaculaceae bacterium]